MIVGNGLIARAIKKKLGDDDGFVYFASGVSDSSTDSLIDFNRERKLLEEHLSLNSNSRFVYFSSCSIYDLETPYSRHKRDMENLVKENSTNYNIFRLPQVVGHGGNRKNLFNFLINSVKSENEISLWKGAKRNFIDVDDIMTIMQNILRDYSCLNKTINIATPFSINIESFVSQIGHFTGVKPIVIIGESKFSYNIDISDIESIVLRMSIFPQNPHDYISQLLNKYCGDN